MSICLKCLDCDGQHGGMLLNWYLAQILTVDKFTHEAASMADNARRSITADLTINHDLCLFFVSFSKELP